MDRHSIRNVIKGFIVNKEDSDMQVLSFSEPWMVRKILEQIKNQSMRPLCKCKHHPDGHHYKVGEIVKLMYKCRSTPKGSFFCKECGKVNRGSKLDLIDFRYWECPKCGKIGYIPKHFATVKVTDVFEVELRIITGSGGRVAKAILTKREDVLNGNHNEFAQRDGFKDAEEMFDWFHKAYDLSTPRRFATYRWEMIK